MHSKIPTISASNIASSVYNLSEESTMLPNTLETKRETSATGPIASWREEPNMAYKKMGTKPESANKIPTGKQLGTSSTKEVRILKSKKYAYSQSP